MAELLHVRIRLRPPAKQDRDPRRRAAAAGELAASPRRETARWALHTMSGGRPQTQASATAWCPSTGLDLTPFP